MTRSRLMNELSADAAAAAASGGVLVRMAVISGVAADRGGAPSMTMETALAEAPAEKADGGV